MVKKQVGSDRNLPFKTEKLELINFRNLFLFLFKCKIIHKTCVNQFYFDSFTGGRL